MRGTYNPKTGKYEQAGQTVQREDPHLYAGMDAEEREEMRQIERIQAEGGTYLERYAKELNVPQGALLKNLLDNNGFKRFSSVKDYTDFKLLRQTLVEEKGPMAKMKAYHNAIADAMGDMKY